MFSRKLRPSLAAELRRLSLNSPIRSIELARLSSRRNLRVSPRLVRPALSRFYATSSEASGESQTTTKKKSTAAKTTTKTAGGSTEKEKKKKKPAKKAVKKPKKTLRQRDPEKVKQNALTKRIRALKNDALLKDEPKRTSKTPYNAFVSMAYRENLVDKDIGLAGASRQIVQLWSSLDDSEKQKYEKLAQQSREANSVKFAEWIASHTPDQIHRANKSRQQLAKIAVQQKESDTTPKARLKSSYRFLPDPRVPPRPLTAYFHFMAEKRANGEYKNLRPAEAARELGNQWKVLSDAQKQEYQSRAKREREAWNEQHRSTLLPDTPLKKRASEATA